MGPPLSAGRLRPRNLPMDPAGLSHVRAEIADRVSRGQVAVYDAPDAVISPIGVVPKASGKLRTIHHLSYPRTGSQPSVNAGVGEAFLRDETLDLPFETVAQSSTPGLQVWKVGLQDAF